MAAASKGLRDFVKSVPPKQVALYLRLYAMKDEEVNSCCGCCCLHLKLNSFAAGEKYVCVCVCVCAYVLA